MKRLRSHAKRDDAQLEFIELLYNELAPHCSLSRNFGTIIFLKAIYVCQTTLSNDIKV